MTVSVVLGISNDGVKPKLPEDMANLTAHLCVPPSECRGDTANRIERQLTLSRPFTKGTKAVMSFRRGALLTAPLSCWSNTFLPRAAPVAAA